MEGVWLQMEGVWPHGRVREGVATDGRGVATDGRGVVTDERGVVTDEGVWLQMERVCL